MIAKATLRRVRHIIDDLRITVRLFCRRHELAVTTGLLLGWIALIVIGLSIMAAQPDRSGPTTASPSTATSRSAPTTLASPKALAPTTPSAPSQPTPTDTQVHQVGKGETLAEIGLHYQVPMEQIATDNGLRNVHRISVGQRLVIGPAPAKAVVIEPGTTLSGYAQRHGVSIAELMLANPTLTDPDHIVAGAGLRIPSKR